MTHGTWKNSAGALIITKPIVHVTQNSELVQQLWTATILSQGAGV